jgi:molybdate transport system substrate-binding protein
MATRHVLADLDAAAVAAGLPHTEIESVGGVDAANRVAAGERFDLVFLAMGALQKLAADGHVVAGSVTPLMLSQVAVAVPVGSPGATGPSGPAEADAPAEYSGGLAFADAAGMRAALQQAARIGYSTGPSGTALVAMVEQWGLTAELGNRFVQAPAGVPVARLVAQGEVDLGFQQLSELVGQPGIRILGVLPPDCAIDTVFAGAVAATTTDPAGARAVLTHFASDAASAVVRAHSFARPAA